MLLLELNSKPVSVYLSAPFYAELYGNFQCSCTVNFRPKLLKNMAYSFAMLK